MSRNIVRIHAVALAANWTTSQKALIAHWRRSHRRAAGAPAVVLLDATREERVVFHRLTVVVARETLQGGHRAGYMRVFRGEIVSGRSRETRMLENVRIRVGLKDRTRRVRRGGARRGDGKIERVRLVGGFAIS